MVQVVIPSCLLCRARSQSPGGSEGEFVGGPNAVRDTSARSDISADSIERNGGGEGQLRFDRAQARWLEELRERGGKVVTVTYPRTANNDKELTVFRGEYLEVSYQPFQATQTCYKY